MFTATLLTFAVAAQLGGDASFGDLAGGGFGSKANTGDACGVLPSTGLRVWLDGDNIDGAGNTLLTNGAAVATWVDDGELVGNLAATSGQQPTFVLSCANGRACLRFDGVDDRFASTLASSNYTFMHNGSDITVYVVAKTTGSNPDRLDALVTTVNAVSTSATGYSLYLDDRASVSRNDMFGVLIGRGGSPAYVNLASINTSFPSASVGILSTITDNEATGFDGFAWRDGGQYGAVAIGGAAAAGAPNGTLTVGAETDGGQPFAGDLFAVAIYNVAHTETQREAIEAQLACRYGVEHHNETWLFVGDSLTAGSGGVTPYPSKITAPSNVAIVNRGVGGNTASQILTQWRASGLVDKLFVMGGINDIAVGTAGTTAYASLDTIFSEAAAMGVSDRIAIETLPFGNAATWTAPRQTELEALNALVAAETDATKHWSFYDLMGDPAATIDILAAYDNGDGVHPNETGTARMAAYVDSIYELTPADFCGDDICEGVETCSTCVADCGECPPSCGDGTCNGAETCSDCAEDCGSCPPACGSPPASANLQAWFDATDIDETGNSSLANNDPVSVWGNKGIANENVTQATAGAKPTYIANCINGEACVRFDGGDRLVGSSLSLYNFMHAATTLGSTVYIVAKTTSANPDALMQLVGTQLSFSSAQRGFNIAFDDRSSLTRNNRVAILYSNGSSAIVNLSSDDNDFIMGQWHQTIVKYAENALGDDYTLYADGVNVKTLARSGAGSASNASAPLWLGIATGSASFPLIGDIAQVLIYDDDLSDVDRAALDTWTACLYGSFPQ